MWAGCFFLSAACPSPKPNDSSSHQFLSKLNIETKYLLFLNELSTKTAVTQPALTCLQTSPLLKSSKIWNSKTLTCPLHGYVCALRALDAPITACNAIFPVTPYLHTLYFFLFLAYIFLHAGKENSLYIEWVRKHGCLDLNQTKWIFSLHNGKKLTVSQHLLMILVNFWMHTFYMVYI